MTDSLVKLGRATQMLAEIRTVDDAKQLIDLAEAARVYARQVDLGLEAQNHAAEIKLRAQRRAGEVLKEMDKAKGGQPYQQNSTPSSLEGVERPPTYTEMDIRYSDAHSWQTIADMPKEEFEAHIEETKADGKELTTADTMRLAQKLGREKTKKEAQNVGQSVELPPTVDIIHGDFRNGMKQLPDDSVDLIFADPPYGEKYIPLYGELAQIASRVLKPNGSLIAYAGHYALPKVLNLMCPHLRFWWTLAVKHGGGSARLPGKWIFVGWKPMLWFVKGGRRDNRYVSDIVDSIPTDKIYHDWEQSLKEAAYYIEYLTYPGDLVVDPFVGSGTTLIAALQLGRHGWGCDVDEEQVAIAKGRIAGVYKTG